MELNGQKRTNKQNRDRLTDREQADIFWDSGVEGLNWGDCQGIKQKRNKREEKLRGRVNSVVISWEEAAIGRWREVWRGK